MKFLLVKTQLWICGRGILTSQNENTDIYNKNSY